MTNGQGMLIVGWQMVTLAEIKRLRKERTVLDSVVTVLLHISAIALFAWSLFVE